MALAEFMRRVVGGFVRAVRSEAGTPTSAQSETLGLLDREGPMSIADLARLRRVRHQSMRLVVAQLEAEGLVRKAVDPQDARRQLVDLSPVGEDVLAQSRTARAEWIAQALQAEFTQNERESLRDALGLMERLVRSHLKRTSALAEHGEHGG